MFTRIVSLGVALAALLAVVKELAHASRVIKTSKPMGSSNTYLNCGVVDIHGPN